MLEPCRKSTEKGTSLVLGKSSETQKSQRGTAVLPCFESVPVASTESFGTVSLRMRIA